MTILTSIALILIGVYANLPHAISIVLYVFSGVSTALNIVSMIIDIIKVVLE